MPSPKSQLRILLRFATVPISVRAIPTMERRCSHHPPLFMGMRSLPSDGFRHGKRLRNSDRLVRAGSLTQGLRVYFHRTAKIKTARDALECLPIPTNAKKGRGLRQWRCRDYSRPLFLPRPGYPLRKLFVGVCESNWWVTRCPENGSAPSVNFQALRAGHYTTSS